VRGLRLIEAADVVIWDRILGPDYLQRLGLDVSGKRCEWLGHDHYGPERQEDINHRLVAYARDGLVVARVKNGDPLVFGRGAEEAEFLEDHGVAWEFVPGLSSSISILTANGFPITNRGIGRSFAVVSARLAGGDFNQRFPHADSMVVLMGFKVMADVRQRLLAEGWSMTTPAVVIERGTMIEQRLLRGTLADIVEQAAAAGFDSPLILALGAVAERRYVPGQPVG
ncbi:MAG: uroporphyrinogen-III C-methyltransferase, partial [Planctomycetota bacterium]